MKMRNIKIIISFLIPIAMIFTGLLPHIDVKAATVIKSRDWTKYKSTYFYNTLNADEKAFYDELEKACVQFISSTDDAWNGATSAGQTSRIWYVDVVPAYNLKIDRAHAILDQFILDNPQYYFLIKAYYDIYNANDKTYYVGPVVYAEFANGEDRAKVTNAIFDKADNWETEVLSKATSRLEKEKAVSDVINVNVSYESVEHNQDIYSAFIYGKTVCNGYTMLSTMMLNAVGVPAVYVRSERHAWNKVCLDDGNWYAADFTWNDSWNERITTNGYPEILKNYYLNRADKTMTELDETGAHVIIGPACQPECNLDHKTDYDDEYIIERDYLDGKLSVIIKKRGESGSSINMGNGIGDQLIRDAGGTINNSNDNGSNNNSGGGNNNSNNSSSNNSINNSNNNSNSNSNNNSNGSSNTSSGQNNSNNGSSGSSTSFRNEWRNGKWYDGNGNQSYEGTLSWKCNSTGWWVEDTAGWYPSDQWQKIDGIWYFFKPDGYMAMGEYYNGYWFNSDGSWDEKYFLSWKCNSTGWWVEDISGWWPASSWLKIDGCWYYFDSSGYMVTNQYVDGYWIGAYGVCQ